MTSARAILPEMQYMGGKSKIRRFIAKEILDRKGARTRYVEPFVGGGSIFSDVAPSFENASAGDASEDLILMWQAISTGWLPPNDLTEEEFLVLKDSPPSALKAFAGFGCSYGGKWFRGFAHSKAGRSHAAQSYRCLVKQAPAFKGRDIQHGSYEMWDGSIDANTVVYCDPPYAASEGYGAVASFDHERFWAVAEEWSRRGALVLVSEYVAPPTWTPVWEREHNQRMANEGHGRTRTTERLFVNVTR